MKYIVSIDIGGTTFNSGIFTDSLNQVAVSKKDKIRFYKSKNDVVDAIVKQVNDLIDSVDISKSRGVIGFVYQKGYTYISLDNSKIHKIVFGKNTKPYLIYANKRLISVKGNIYKFDKRFGKLKVKFFLPRNCKYIQKNSVIKAECAASE